MRLPFYVWRIRFYRGKYVMVKLYLHIGKTGISWKMKRSKYLIEE